MERESRRELFETIGLVAVVATVVVLIVKTRQNTGTLYAQSRQSVLAARKKVAERFQ
jgi:hypothetical protein